MAEVEVIFVAVGESIEGGVLATHTPPVRVYQLLQVYSHLVAQHAFTTDLVTLAVRLVSSPVQSVAFDGTVH